ncbi:MAG: ferritin family protein [Thermoanaerobaculales bacterium]
MPVRVDFRTLSPADALDLAVLMEEETRQRYIEFAEMLEEVHHSHDAAAFCRVMVENEERHGFELLQRRERLYPDTPPRVTASMLLDVEAPEYDRPVAFMTPRTCMEMALAAETKAEHFFRDALSFTSNLEVRALLVELADEEVDHQRMVRDQLANLPAAQD